MKFENVGVVEIIKKSFLSYCAGDDRNLSSALPSYAKLRLFGMTLPPKRRSYESKWFDCMVERRDIMKVMRQGFGRRLRIVNIFQAPRVVHLHAVCEPPSPRPQLRHELRRLLLLQQRLQEGRLAFKVRGDYAGMLPTGMG